MDVLKAQFEARAKDLEVAKAIVDTCASEDRAMTVDERVAFDRANEEFSRRTKMIDEIKAMSAHEAEVRAAQAGHEDEVRPVSQVAAPSNDVETIRSLARGEIRSAEFGVERRDVTKGSTGAPVPTSFYDQVIMLARAVGPMLSVGTTLNTASGENLQIPRLSTYSTGTVNSEAATLGESDPAFSAFITLTHSSTDSLLRFPVSFLRIQASTFLIYSR